MSSRNPIDASRRAQPSSDREPDIGGQPNRTAWPWLGLIVLLATAYVWWLSLGALRMASGG